LQTQFGEPFRGSPFCFSGINLRQISAALMQQLATSNAQTGLNGANALAGNLRLPHYSLILP
jgi:hypothetical protein